MIAEDVLDKQVSPTFCSALGSGGGNVHILSQSVNKDNNCVKASLSLSKTCDKVS